MSAKQLLAVSVTCKYWNYLSGVGWKKYASIVQQNRIDQLINEKILDISYYRMLYILNHFKINS